jgi:hypothetical protein
LSRRDRFSPDDTTHAAGAAKVLSVFSSLVGTFLMRRTAPDPMEAFAILATIRRSQFQEIPMQEFMLTEKETVVLIELLRAEQRTLEPEIRRTDARDMKKRLRERLRTVDRLIERFEELGQRVSS